MASRFVVNAANKRSRKQYNVVDSTLPAPVIPSPLTLASYTVQVTPYDSSGYSLIPGNDVVESVYQFSTGVVFLSGNLKATWAGALPQPLPLTISFGINMGPAALTPQARVGGVAYVSARDPTSATNKTFVVPLIPSIGPSNFLKFEGVYTLGAPIGVNQFDISFDIHYKTF